MNHRNTQQGLDTLAARFAGRVTAALNDSNDALPHDLTERLRFAREQALTKARAARALQPESAGAIVASGQGNLALGGGSPRWLKAASILPLLLLLAGLLLIQHSQWYEQIRAAAEVDTALLTDKVPPAAYGDPGFSEYLHDEQP